MGKVLIVDDDLTLCELLKEMITIFGYETIVAENKNLAVKNYKKEAENIDLAIIDMNLDDATGDEVYKELMEINNKFTAILATGMTADLDKDEFFDLGFKEIINKPYSMDQIQKLVKKYM